MESSHEWQNRPQSLETNERTQTNHIFNQDLNRYKTKGSLY